MWWVDRLVAGMLAPLAVWVLASGLDDLFLDLCAICFRVARWWRVRRGSVSPESGARAHAKVLPEKRIALFIPAWREDGVIEQMLDRNLEAIEYSNYEIFVGVYPNDAQTLSRVQACERKYGRMHQVVCPHDGPTSKADCLNWIYRGMVLYEEKSGTPFEIILHHGAEDVIHPRSLEWANAYCERYDMVQIPVLPLATPWWEWTHGTYCDEFAQSHLKELHARVGLKGFLPSAGVGTAYRRRALDRLAWNNRDQLFHPTCLTEDYRIGLELNRLGCPQILFDASRLGESGEPGATREYFPRSFRGAVRQKSRWVAGIALQCWQEVGWRAGAGQLYWLWRDRKGLVGNPLSILANLLFLCGLAGWARARVGHHSWYLAEMVGGSILLQWLLGINTGLILVRLVSRALCVRLVYGWRHALFSPVRSIWGNIINFWATLRAVGLFAAAQARREAPAWTKTDHAYPVVEGCAVRKRRLGEVLVELRLVAAVRVEEALRNLEGERLGERLTREMALNEFQLYTALGIQQGVPFEPVEPEFVVPEALQRLPWQWARRLQVIPMRITDRRRLWIAGPEVPPEEAVQEVSRITGLQPEFQLITPTNYRQLVRLLER